MTEETHDPLHCVSQLRQTLAADKLPVGFFLGAGCPCAVRVPGNNEGSDRPLIPDIKGLTVDVHARVIASPKNGDAFKKLIKAIDEDGEPAPTVETVLNRVRALREVAGKSSVRELSFLELDALDKEICQSITQTVTCSLPDNETPYHALANFIRTHRNPTSEIFTTNYDVLMEQALETCRAPFFDGFVGSSRPFFDQRAIEEDKIPARWSRLWKLHGSINWRFNKISKHVYRSVDISDGDEMLIHPSHLKYDESRRMPYFVMIDRLRNFLRNGGDPVAIVVVGYSFSDEHINEAIIESLKANPSAACFALQYGNIADYPKARVLARDNANLSVLAPDSAIIRRREATWMARPATDIASLRGAFEIVKPKTPAAEAKTSGTESEQSDAAQPCRFRLGNFKQFGDFLNEFSRYRITSGVGVSA